MNETLRTLHDHRSIRAYTDQPVAEETLTALIAAVQHVPSSMNGQQVSLIVVRDAEKRKQISVIAGGQPWIAQAPVFIALVIDFHKTALGVAESGGRQVIHESLEGIIVGAIDAGIILGNLMTAAESLGLGIVPIGAMRANPRAMIDLLQLPLLTFPVVGMCLGYPADRSHRKPRLPLATFRHEECYQGAGLAAAIREYDQILLDHWQKVARGEGTTWSASLAAPYSRVYFPEVYPVARAQGFTNDK
ncbi:MAG: NADPH-dependent oxidoreductase [Magnetococcales bacterium]|nr:NADPH-dependent oxidoreductase [Magnetococcales bacterium]